MENQRLEIQSMDDQINLKTSDVDFVWKLIDPFIM